MFLLSIYSLKIPTFTWQNQVIFRKSQNMQINLLFLNFKRNSNLDLHTNRLNIKRCVRESSRGISRHAPTKLQSLFKSAKTYKTNHVQTVKHCAFLNVDRE